jgi:uncharacterized protein
MESPDSKISVVIGASEKPYRYSHAAVHQLRKYGHEVVAIGRRPGRIEDTEIVTGFPKATHVHTVTLYIGPQHQPPYYNYILEELKPQRVIFNPGTENSELYALCRENGIDPVENCTLMMLNYGVF